MTQPGGDPIVIGALHSAEAIGAATSMLGKRTLHVVGRSELVGALEVNSVRAVLFELGHEAFVDLYTRSAIGTRMPLLILLPAGRIPTRELCSLAQARVFSLSYSPRELPAVFRRMVNQGPSSDVHRVAESLRVSLPAPCALLGLGLYVTGVRNTTVSRAARRLGAGAGLRNRLRVLKMGRASTILGWASALGIVWRVEREGCSLSDAAHAAGFETTRQCSDRVLYHTGRTPTALRRVGFESLVAEFVGVVAGKNLSSPTVRYRGDQPASFSYRAPPPDSHSGASHSWRNSWSYESGV